MNEHIELIHDFILDIPITNWVKETYFDQKLYFTYVLQETYNYSKYSLSGHLYEYIQIILKVYSETDYKEIVNSKEMLNFRNVYHPQMVHVRVMIHDNKEVYYDMITLYTDCVMEYEITNPRTKCEKCLFTNN